MYTVNLTYLNGIIACVVLYYMALYVHLQVKRRLVKPGADEGYRPFVFVIIPAHNEEEVIGHTIESLLGQDYPHLAIMVMNDGSKDATSEIGHQYADRHDGVVVVDRGPDIAGQGKGAVLNHAYEIICGLVESGDPRLEGRSADDVIIAITDADGQLESHTLSSVTRLFADAKVGGVQIGVRIANNYTNILTRLQDIEFVGFSAFVQEARDSFGSVGLGGNGQFTRLSALISLGYAPWTDCLTEDLDLGLSLVQLGWRIRFCPGAFVAQQAVTNLKLLFRQRTRWIQGHYQCWSHLPSLVRERTVPLHTRLDLAVYLVLVVFVVVVSVGMVLSILSLLGIVVLQSSLLIWIPAGPPRNIANIALSFGPLVAFLITYQSRSPSPLPTRWLPAYSVIFAFYTYAWMVATGWAWTRMLLGHGSWAKTPRVKSESAV